MPNKLLDLFCGAGGSAKGYNMAGFDIIVGIDTEKITNYPYNFIQADVLEYLKHEDLTSFDLVHASPPYKPYETLINQTRELLISKGVNYVIEHLPPAPLISALRLEGLMFGLPLKRRRLFETNWPIDQLPIVRNISKNKLVTVGGPSINGSNNYHDWAVAMQIWWMTEEQLVQAIPPKYTEYIGQQFFKRI